MPFRVTHLATTAADGAGIAAKRLHEALLAAGVDSRMLVRDPVNAGPLTETLNPPPFGWRERLALRIPFSVSKNSIREKELRRLLARPVPAPELFSLPHARTRPEDHRSVHEADIVHLHWVSGFVDQKRFFSCVPKPMVWTLHDQQPFLGGFHYENDRDAHPAYRALESECLAVKRAALTKLSRPPLLVLGNSRWNTEAARTSAFFPEGTRFETVYYPLDSNLYSPSPKPAAKLALGIAPESRVIGFACTDLENSRKGLSDLLAALHALENTVGAPSFTLLSFGRPPAASARAALRSPWRHLGYLNEDIVKCGAYAAMDCFVIPSRAEAFGQTAIEALASGTCVLGSAVGGIPETLPSARHAEALYPAGDTRALAHRLQSLLENPEARAAIARDGRQHVVRQHGPSTIASQLTDFYRSLALPA